MGEQVNLALLLHFPEVDVFRTYGRIGESGFPSSFPARTLGIVVMLRFLCR